MTTPNDNLPGRIIGKRHTLNQNDAPEYYSEGQSDYSYNLEAEFNRVCDERDDLLAAARTVEAQSHWDNDINGYVVAKEAMDALCAEIFK